MTGRNGRIDINNIDMTKNEVSTSFGGQHFRVVLCSSLNCIRVDISGEHPLPVLERLEKLIGEVVEDSFKQLQYFCALYYSSQNLYSPQDLHDFSISKIELNFLYQ